MNIAKVIAALEKAGLTDHKPVNVWQGENSKPGIMVMHDYSGLYPGKDTFEKYHAACKIAKRFGLSAENRGHYVATLIY